MLREESEKKAQARLKALADVYGRAEFAENGIRGVPHTAVDICHRLVRSNVGAHSRAAASPATG